MHGGEFLNCRLTKPRWRLAFLQTDSMWFDQLRLEEMSTPRYLTLQQGAIWCPLTEIPKTSGLGERVRGVGVTT